MDFSYFEFLENSSMLGKEYQKKFINKYAIVFTIKFELIHPNILKFPLKIQSRDYQTAVMSKNGDTLKNQGSFII